MPQDAGYSTTFWGTATGVTTISSAPCSIRGILFTSTGTAFCNLYSCASTASATGAAAIGDAIVAYLTVAAVTANAAVYYPFPAGAPNGLTIDIGASADPSLLLFYDPEGITIS